MATPVNVLYEFGPFQLDPPERLLLCDGKPVSLPPKAFDLLLALVDRSGHLVEKDELLKIVWPGAFVEEGNLAVTVSLVRKALNDDRGHHKYIETVSKRGYRFVAEVKRRDESTLIIAGTGKPEKPATRPVLPEAAGTNATWPERRKNRWVGLGYSAVVISLVALLVVSITQRMARQTQ